MNANTTPQETVYGVVYDAAERIVGENREYLFPIMELIKGGPGISESMCKLCCEVIKLVKDKEQGKRIAMRNPNVS